MSRTSTGPSCKQIGALNVAALRGWGQSVPVNMFYRAAAHCIYLYLKCIYIYIIHTVYRLQKCKVSKNTVLHNWSASSSDKTWQPSHSTPLASAALAICSICTIFEMEPTLWWWLANKGPEQMTSCWMLAATRSWGLKVHSMAGPRSKAETMLKHVIFNARFPFHLLSWVSCRKSSNEHSSTASQISDITACRTCPFIDWKRMPSELLTDIVSQTWHKPARWASKCHPSVKTGVREECSVFCTVNLIYHQSCTFTHCPRHRRRHHSHHRRHQHYHHHHHHHHHHQSRAEHGNNICNRYIMVCIYKCTIYTYIIFTYIYIVYTCSNTNYRKSTYNESIAMKAPKPPRAPCKAADNHAFSIWDRLFHGQHAVMPFFEAWDFQALFGVQVRCG